MKKNLLYFFSVLFVGMFFISCSEEEKIEPVKVSEYVTYEQPNTKLKIKVPKGWPQSEDASIYRFIAYSDAQGKKAFDNANSPEKDVNEHIPGAKIEIWTKIMDSTKNFDHFFELKPLAENIYKPRKDAMIGSTKGFMQSYEFPFGYEGLLQGEIYYAVREDTLGGVLTIVNFEVLDRSMKHYRPYFDEILKSVEIAHRPEVIEQDTIVEKKAGDPPSKTMKTVSGDVWKMSIPKNFQKESFRKGRGVIKNYNYMGQRRGDCNILVDQLKPNSKKLADIASELAKKVPGASRPKAIKLGGGLQGFVYAYKPRTKAGKHMSQAYITKVGENLYRITINWFTGKNKIDGKDEEPLFKEIFIRSAKSFRAK